MFCITNRTLSLQICGSQVAQVVGADGCGARTLTLPPANFAALYADYAVAMQPFGRESIGIRVLIDHGNATVALLADAFACEIAGSVDEEELCH